MRQPVAIALGSNLGDREAMLDRAVAELDRLPGLELSALSSLYESAPWGDTDQGAFLNAVVAGECSLAPEELLRATQDIEQRLGKRVVRPWGPRAIDLDLLLVGDLACQAESLVLPHPHLRARPFVVLPLAEVARGQWPEFLELDDEGRRHLADTKRLSPQRVWPSRPVPRHWETESHTEEATADLGGRLGRAARPGDVFALSGPLGAGKSCLVRGMARGLGLTGPIPSPTYTICREYSGGRAAFQHWDFYRLGDGDDLESTGFADKVEEPAVIAIEWADLFAEELPGDRLVEVRLERIPADETRRLGFRFPPGALALRVALSCPPRAENCDAGSGN